jgi:Holliday junction resolvase RusA-like endonuclease
MITLPFPPSVNNLFPTGDHGKRFKSKKYQTWLAAAEVEFYLQHCEEQYKGPFRITILLGKPKNKDGSRSQVRRDLANHEKSVTDFLVAKGVIEDDYLAQELHMAWAPITGCQVTIEEVAEK